MVTEDSEIYCRAIKSRAMWRDVAFDALVEYDQMFRNLTSVQARCTELLEETRKLKAQYHQDKNFPQGWGCSGGVSI